MVARAVTGRSTVCAPAGSVVGRRSHKLAATLACVAVTLVAAVPCAAQWSAPQVVYRDPVGRAQFPAVAAMPTGVTVAMTTVRPDSIVIQFPDEILISTKTSAGWSAPQNVSNTPFPSSYPALAATTDGRVHVVWQEALPPPREVVGTRVLYTDGLSAQPIALFSPEIDVESETPSVDLPSISLVAGRGDALHLTFRASFIDGGYTMYMRCAGGVWSEPRRLTTDYYGALSVGPDGTLYLASLGFDEESGATFPDRLVHLRVSDDDGATWSAPVDAGRAPQQGDLALPRIIAAPGGALHAVWLARSTALFPTETFHAVSFDHGQTWTPPETLRPVRAYVTSAETVADACGRLHLFSLELSEDFEASVVTHRMWENSRWSAPVVPFGNTSVNPSAHAPALALDASGRLHAAWTEGSLAATTTYYASAVLTSLGPADAPASESAPARPNPTRDTTTVSFTLTVPGDVQIDVYAADGRLVDRRLLGGRVAGTQSAALSVSGLAAGAYSYVVRSGTEQSTGRFVVVH